MCVGAGLGTVVLSRGTSGSGTTVRGLAAFTGLMHAETLVDLAPPVSFAFMSFGFVGIHKGFAWPFGHPCRDFLSATLGFAGFSLFLRGFFEAFVLLRTTFGRILLVQFGKLSFQSKNLGLFISGRHPLASFNQGFELVAGKIHEAVHSEWGTIITILLFLLNVTTEIDIRRREITLEQVGQEILSGFTSGQELIFCDLDKGIELVNVTFELLQLVRK